MKKAVVMSLQVKTRIWTAVIHITLPHRNLFCSGNGQAYPCPAASSQTRQY